MFVSGFTLVILNVEKAWEPAMIVSILQRKEKEAANIVLWLSKFVFWESRRALLRRASKGLRRKKSLKI